MISFHYGLSIVIKILLGKVRLAVRYTYVWYLIARIITIFYKKERPSGNEVLMWLLEECVEWRSKNGQYREDELMDVLSCCVLIRYSKCIDDDVLLTLIRSYFARDELALIKDSEKSLIKHHKQWERRQICRLRCPVKLHEMLFIKEKLFEEDGKS